MVVHKTKLKSSAQNYLSLSNSEEEEEEEEECSNDNSHLNILNNQRKPVKNYQQGRYNHGCFGIL